MPNEHLNEQHEEKDVVQWAQFEDPVEALGFTQIPNCLIRNPLINEQELRLYILLKSYAWESIKCWPGEDKLASHMGIKPRQLRNILQNLRKKGLLQIRRRGLGMTNLYIFKKIPKYLTENQISALSDPSKNERQNNADLDRQKIASMENSKPASNSMRQKIASMDRQNNADLDRQESADKEYSVKEYSDTISLSDSLADEASNFLHQGQELSSYPYQNTSGKTQKTQQQKLAAEEVEIVSLLTNIPEYPVNSKIDLQMIRDFREEFPDLDLLHEIRAWKLYLIDNPLRSGRGGRPRLRLRKWLARAQPKPAQERKTVVNQDNLPLGPGENWPKHQSKEDKYRDLYIT